MVEGIEERQEGGFYGGVPCAKGNGLSAWVAAEQQARAKFLIVYVGLCLQITGCSGVSQQDFA